MENAKRSTEQDFYVKDKRDEQEDAEHEGFAVDRLWFCAMRAIPRGAWIGVRASRPLKSRTGFIFRRRSAARTTTITTMGGLLSSFGCHP